MRSASRLCSVSYAHSVGRVAILISTAPSASSLDICVLDRSRKRRSKPLRRGLRAFRVPARKTSPGDILVSNFNNSGNLQGMGTSIVRVQLSPQPMFQQTSTFATTGKVTGLTAALGVIKQGFVFVGSVPTTDG